MKILITGFGAFPGVEQNPTEQVIAVLKMKYADEEYFISSAEGWSLPGHTLTLAVLPVEYAGADAALAELLAAGPDVYLALGVAAGRKKLSLERVALNLDDAEIADNAGEQRQGVRIAADGPEAYISALPLEDIREALEAAGLETAITNHAGTYLCNHVYYQGQKLASAHTRTLFMHVPALSPDSADSGAAEKTGAQPATALLGPVWTLEKLVRAAQICATVLVNGQV